MTLSGYTILCIQYHHQQSFNQQSTVISNYRTVRSTHFSRFKTNHTFQKWGNRTIVRQSTFHCMTSVIKPLIQMDEGLNRASITAPSRKQQLCCCPPPSLFCQLSTNCPSQLSSQLIFRWRVPLCQQFSHCVFSSITVDNVRDVDVQEVLSVLGSRVGKMSKACQCWCPMLSAIILLFTSSSVHWVFILCCSVSQRRCDWKRVIKRKRNWRSWLVAPLLAVLEQSHRGCLLLLGPSPQWCSVSL